MRSGESEQRPESVVDPRLWGKHEGLSAPYPVICHLLDTAAIAGVLWDVWAPGLGVLRQPLGGGLAGEVIRKLVCFWAGLHDVGKVSPSFQALVDDLYRSLVAESPEYGRVGDEPVRGLRHNEISHWVLVEILRGLGYPGSDRVRRDVSHQIAQLLGGHHGVFCPAMKSKARIDPRGSSDGVGTGVWEQQCRAHAAVLQQLTGAHEALKERLPVPVAVVVLGIVIVADWLASQERFIRARMPVAGWSASPEELGAHWRRAVAEAPQAVRDAGLGAADFEDRTFQDLFGFEPNTLQASVMDELPTLVKGPGLLLVTAPPGDGKTEVALFAAGVLARATAATGLGFCLPTMATTDAMHTRVARFAGKALREDAALTRVHSMAWLSTDAAGAAAAQAAEADAVISDQDASVAAAQWLHARRRGLLAPLSTFTIDQGLTGVLPVKYNVLRMLALAGKVVVIDEAHSYDAWMHALLVRLLEWLGALKAPVVLLSATLTGMSARSLVEAYLRGSGHEMPGELRPRYPGWVFADAVTGAVSPPREVASERERTLRMERRMVRRGPNPEQSGHRISVIKELLQPVAQGDRGCALVCCTTVAEAQETHRLLAEWFQELKRTGTQPPELRLLHSRFRARDRAAITDSCETDFGKDGTRPRTVVVATQIVEQSLDLDFDLLITDLAPMALLLQRSGRCQRHRNADGDRHRDRRPGWIGPDPHIVVLDPVDAEGEFTVPEEWGDVYDRSLLQRTSTLLQAWAQQPIEVPGDVQELVDAVYADDFASLVSLEESEALEIEDADGERLAKQAAHRQLANIVRIESPHSSKLHDLWKLSNTEAEVDESLIATRLGADSERLVCVHEQAPGVWTLDEDGAIPVPGLPGGARVSSEQARVIAQYMIPVPGRHIGDGAELLERPSSWEKNSVLREWVLLPMRRDSQGRWRGRLRQGTTAYGQTTGLVSNPYLLL